MKVELVSPESVTGPRHWVRHDQAFAMMLGPGSIEWGSRRSALEKFNYAVGDLALCDRHIGEWVGVMNIPHLQLGISDAPLMAASDGAYGEVELRAHRKFADPRLRALVAKRAIGIPLYFFNTLEDRGAPQNSFVSIQLAVSNPIGSTTTNVPGRQETPDDQSSFQLLTTNSKGH